MRLARVLAMMVAIALFIAGFIAVETAPAHAAGLLTN
jgi:hypothetical protein